MPVSGILRRPVDIDKGILREHLGFLLAEGDTGAHTFEITVLASGKNVDLTGCAITGYFMRSTDETVVCTGSVSGGKAILILPQSCYAVIGRFDLIIRASQGTTKTSIYWCDGTIVDSISDTLVDPGKTIPNLDELLARIAEMDQKIQAANSASDRANAAAESLEGAVERAEKVVQDANSAVESAVEATDKAVQDAKNAAEMAIEAADTANSASEVIQKFTTKWGNVTVSVVMRDSDFSAICTVTDSDTGGVLFTFELPRGLQGLTGATPNFTIGTVETLSYGTGSYATITGTAENPILNLFIERGKAGEGNVKSVNGVEPDENGNVAIDAGDGTVKSVNGILPDQNGNVEIDAGPGDIDVITTEDIESVLRGD